MPKNKVNNNIKLKSGGGILNGVDGLELDPTTQPLTSYTATALEDLTAGDSLAYVQANQEVLTNQCTAVLANNIYFIQSNTYKTAQTFTASKDKLKYVVFKLGLGGYSIGGYCSSIALFATDGTGKPTGSAIETFSFSTSQLDSDLGSYGTVDQIATFTSSLTAGTKYALVLSYTGTLNSSQRIAIPYSSTSQISNGEALYFDGTNWGAVAAGADFNIEIYETDNNAGLIKSSKTSLTQFIKLGATEKFAGICSADVVKGGIATVLIDKYTTTGLTPGLSYYLDGAGTLSTTNNTIYNVSAGSSLSDTILKINKVNNNNSGKANEKSIISNVSASGRGGSIVTLMFKPGYTGKFYYEFSTYNSNSTATQSVLKLDSTTLHSYNSTATTPVYYYGVIDVTPSSVITITQTNGWNSGIINNYSSLKSLTAFI